MTNGTDTRQRAEELLLMRLNGRLSAEEQAELDGLLAQDPSLGDEEDFLKALKSELAARDIGPSPGELGLARLKREVEADMKGTTALGSDSRNVVGFTPRAARNWRIAAVAATLLFAIQTIVFVTNPEGALRLAGGLIERSSGPVFVVAFVPDATEAQIRDLLIGIDMNIVSGPSALGLYQIEAAEGTDPTTALAALERAPVVESAERK